MNHKTFLKGNRELIISIIFVVAVLSILLLPKNKKENIAVKIDPVIERKRIDYQVVLNSIEAKSFYVYDILDKKSIFSKDEHVKLPLASITKLMSGLVILDIMPDTTIVTITKDDLALEGDSGLHIGEKWKLKDLLDFTLISSSNDGMHAISSALNYYQAINNTDTIKIMNERIKLWGLNDTIFINETGLDIDNNMGGAYSSAYDVSILFEKIIKDNPGLISSTNRQSEDFISESNIKHTALNTNSSLNQISGLIASKTGFTNLAGGNLAIVFDAGFMHPVVVVVLGSTIEGRFSDAIKLEKITLEKLSE
jgi:D-alanyl-D-alanine carboxypeptidase